MACAWPAWCSFLTGPPPPDRDLANAVTSTLVERLSDTDLTVKAVRAHLDRLVAMAAKGGVRGREVDVHAEAIAKRLDEILQLSQTAAHTIHILSEEVALLSRSDRSHSGSLRPASPAPSPLGSLLLQESAVGPSIRDQYVFASVIGQGSCAQVYRATAVLTGQEVAIKVVDRRLVGEKAWHVAVQEASVLRTLRHPHIIELIECAERGGVMYMVLELLTGGDLFERLVRQRQYTEQVAARLTRKIVGALSYMHALGFVHRDIKPENIMLREDCTAAEAGDATERLTNVTLIDFGFAKYCAPGTATLTDCCGTIEYIAPEILQCWMGQRTGYGPACDMWSVGVMTYKLLSGHLPFVAQQEDQTIIKIIRGRYEFKAGGVWDRVSEEAKSFIGQLLVGDPARRLTAKAALAHPWLTAGDALPVHSLGSIAGATPAPTVRLLRALPNTQKNLMVKARVPTGDLRHCHLGDVVPPRLYALDHDVPIQTALQFLAAEHSRCLPVVNAAGHFLGFFHVGQALQLVVDGCRPPPPPPPQQGGAGHPQPLEAGRRAALTTLLASKDFQSAVFSRTVAGVIGPPRPAQSFTLNSNLLDVLRKGFLRLGPDGRCPDRIPLLSAHASPATTIHVVQADGTVQTDRADGPFISGVVTAHAILQLLHAQPAIVGPTLWGRSLEDLSLLNRRVWSVPGTMAAVQAFQLMLDESPAGVAVLDDQGCARWSLSPADFVGVTTRSFPTLALPVDQFLHAQAKARSQSPSPACVCEASCPLGVAIERLVMAHAAALYIVNERRRPIALVTPTEILAVVAQHSASEAGRPSSPLNAPVHRAFASLSPTISPRSSDPPLTDPSTSAPSAATSTPNENEGL